MYVNDMQEVKKFIPSIDNLSTVQVVNNIMIVPLFGTPDIETGAQDVVGILQLINKRDHLITEHDIVSWC